jgi:N-acetylated-alpha-linked acidic dipeptidase
MNMATMDMATPAGRNEAEARMLASLSLEAPWALIEAFARHPRWEPEAVNAAADMIAERLVRLGVPVTVHAPEIYLSIPLDASVEAEGERFRAKPPSMSVSVPEGLSGELVYLPANPKALRSYAKNIAELFGQPASELQAVTERLKGRILVTEGFGNPALTQIVEEWGGIGLIAINPGVDIHWGTCTTIWGSPELDDLPRKPRIPVVAVNKPTGEKLKAVAARRGSAVIRTRMQEGWFVQKIPVVHIPGAGEPERFVLLHGHYDSWDVGVGDNATGDATLLELARVFWQHRGDLRRSVRIAWWPGHSTGRYAGSTWYADASALDLDAGCVAQINCDSPGCRWATSYHQTTTMSEAEALVAGAIRDGAGQPMKPKRPNTAGDYSFNNIGLTSFYMLSSTMPDALRAEKGYYDVSGCGANIAWHTENDQIEIADRDVLATDLKVYLLSVLRVANAEVLPFDFRATAKEFAETLARYQAAVGDAFDLAPVGEALAALSGALERFYHGIADGQIASAAANAVLQDLGRILVPLNFTRQPRFRHDPAFTVPPLPALAVAADLAHLPADQRGFALTQLLRGRNVVIAGLKAATRLVEGVA